MEDIVYRFEKPHLMLEDSLRLFEYYFGQTFARQHNDLDVLFLPEGFYRTTRLCSQGAVLIFPDELRWEESDGRAGADGIRPGEDWYLSEGK